MPCGVRAGQDCKFWNLPRCATRLAGTWFQHASGRLSELSANRQGHAGTERVLNLGFTDWDSREHVLENRRSFFRRIRRREDARRRLAPDSFGYCSRCGLCRGPAATNKPLRATRSSRANRGALLVVQTADCIPILLADTKHRAVAAIHAGWRGTLRRIAKRLSAGCRWNSARSPKTSSPRSGPGIGGCCYEVGHEVARSSPRSFPKRANGSRGPSMRSHRRQRSELASVAHHEAAGPRASGTVALNSI